MIPKNKYRCQAIFSGIVQKFAICGGIYFDNLRVKNCGNLIGDFPTPVF